MKRSNAPVMTKRQKDAMNTQKGLYSASAAHMTASSFAMLMRAIPVLAPFMIIGALLYFNSPQYFELYLWIVSGLWILAIIIFCTINMVDYIGQMIDRAQDRALGVARARNIDPENKALWRIAQEQGIQQVRTEAVGERKLLMQDDDEIDLYEGWGNQAEDADVVVYKEY